MKLHSYYQSSASYRVRIAMNLKTIAVDMATHDLTKNAHFSAEYAAINPQKQVPSLEVGREVLTQSLAIMEYLDEVYPTPPILPREPIARAHARAIALMIAADISPLNNLKVRRYLASAFGASEHQVKTRWIQHWIMDGFNALEVVLARSPHTGIFCVGDFPTIADCCLIPQLFNARLFQCDLTDFPTLRRIAASCEAHPAFVAAEPAKQPDAQ